MELERQPRSSANGGHSPSTDYPQGKHTMQDPCDEAFEYKDAELRAGYGQFELSLVAYARLHELTADYRSQHPLASDLCPVLPADWKFDLNDPEGALNINLLVTLGGLNGHNTHEKLDIGKDAAELLSSVFRLAQSGDSIDEFMCDFAPPFRDLKLEEPMLMSDAEVDLMRLIHRNTATISSDGMKPFPEDEIQDPGFLGPQKHAAMHANLEEHANEKLDIDRPTMEYLNGICHQLSLDGGCDMETDLICPKTPPLLPSSPPSRLEATKAEAMDVELTSSPEDLFRKEATALEQQILDRDSTPSQHWSNTDEMQNMDPSIYAIPESVTESSSSPLSRKRWQGLKIETPLTPENSLEPPAKKAKTVSFSADLYTMIPTIDSGAAASDADLPGDDDLTSFIDKVVQPFAESAIKQVEQEQIDELDTTLRMTVPHLDDFELAVPWKRSSNRKKGIDLSAQTALISQVKNELHQSESKWSGVSKTEKQLPWIPFPTELGKVNIEEEFDDGPLARYLAELVPDGGLDTDSFACEPVIRKVIEDDDDDDLLEPFEYDTEEECPSENNLQAQKAAADLAKSQVAAVLPIQTTYTPEPGRLDMQALLKKRKIELEAAGNKLQAFKSPSGNATGTDSTSKPDRLDAPRPALFMEGTGAAGGLANFIHVHGDAVPPAKMSDLPSGHYQKHATPASAMAPQKEVDLVASKQQSIALPLPAIANTQESLPVVVSSTFFSNRELVRELRKALPGLALVERDLTPTVSMKGGTKPAANHEADITASPGTGVVTTTLQKLRQKPLPGQSVFFGIRDRISLVCSRYNRLVVLVSEGRQQSDDDGTSTGPLDTRDVQTISDLVGFACSLENDVEIHFVAGGDRELARWIAGVISRTALSEYNGVLLQEETLWERLLRQAGLNPFAAQYILFKLKPMESSTNLDASSVSGASSIGTSGLAAFVQMTTAQRVEMFGQAVGQKALERASEVMDRGWVPVLQKEAHRAQHHMVLSQGVTARTNFMF